MVCSSSLSFILTASLVLKVTRGQVPTPTVTINSSTVTVGSDVTLTCSVVFSLAVDVPVTVNTVWTGPVGFTNTTTAQPVMGRGTTYTSTAIVSSFGRHQSGVYTCNAAVSSTSSFTNNSVVTVSTSTRVTVGVYLSLRGVVYRNNSHILITKIGQTHYALQCVTDRIPCCAALISRVGEWLFPDGSSVPTRIFAATFYRSRGDDGTVNLNRNNNDVMMPTGRFCCVVPDATSTEVTVCANIVTELPLTTAIPTQGNIDQSVTFHLTSSVDSIDVSFSLICNSTGGPVTSLSWTRNGLLLSKTNPLVPTNVSTSSYINVLEVNSRTPGEYICLIRGPNDELLNSTIFDVQAGSPPVNVQASQLSASAPVEVSWSPPSGGATTITGYRIFYGNRENIFVSSYVTRIVFNFIEIKDELGEILSIHSESTQLPSEAVNVRVTNEIVCHSAPSSSTNVGIAVGVTIFIVLAAVVVANIIFLLCLLKYKRRKKQPKSEISVSANLAYGQVKLDPGGGEYEDPDKIRSGQGNYELMQHSAHDECSGSKQAAAVFITAKDVCR